MYIYSKIIEYNILVIILYYNEKETKYQAKKWYFFFGQSH